MNSIFISTKRWFDKVNGNSYFAARVYVDGVEVARLPFQYGYERADEYAAVVELTALGLTAAGNVGLDTVARNAGAVLYRAPIAYFTKAEVKRWGAENA
jgi:hypothetical protein